MQPLNFTIKTMEAELLTLVESANHLTVDAIIKGSCLLYSKKDRELEVVQVEKD